MDTFKFGEDRMSIGLALDICSGRLKAVFEQ